jgi:hypothetical protein
MNGRRWAKVNYPGACVTVATKLRPEEAEALDNIAGSLLLSRYELVRLLLLRHIEGRKP